MFKILITQALYNLSDERIEFQVLDRCSFSRFLGIQVGGKVPDATTINRFLEELAKANVIEFLFIQFNQFLRNDGFKAQIGQIVDASIVRVPIQINSCDENKDIKTGKNIKSFGKAKRRQKDTDVR